MTLLREKQTPATPTRPGLTPRGQARIRACPVMKFGGTSVADRPAIERLIHLVRARRHTEATAPDGGPPGPVVIVSALAGVTDRLLGVAALAAAGDAEGAQTHLRQLYERHIAVSDVVDNETLRAEVLASFTAEFGHLQRLLSALAVLREVSPRWMDTIAATGELLSSRLVAATLSAHALPAAWVDARQVIVTTNDHQAALPLFPETTAALATHVYPLLDRGCIPVMGGFVGATPDGITTTLGRGGSDYSAAIVGACLEAREIQIWTDVDGILTADPQLVEHARPVPHLSFAEAAELAYFGAKVLHPATIQPAMTRDIPVRVLNARHADRPGTLITASGPGNGRPLTAVASKAGVSILEITSTRMLMAYGFLSRLFAVFERHRTPVDVVTTSEVSVSVTVDDTRRLSAIIDELSDFADVTCEHGMAIVCAVGDGLQRAPALAARVLTSVGDVPIRLISQSASRRNVTFVVPETGAPAALSRIHEAFFAADPATPVGATGQGG